MILPGSNRDDPRQSVRHGGFTVLIAIPRHHGAIGFQGKRVIPARGDGGHADESRRHGQGVILGRWHCRTIVFLADGHHGSVHFQNKT